MKRRSKAGGELVKGRRRKAPEPKRSNTLKAAAPSTSPAPDRETDVARLTRELSEALERQAATSEVLGVVSRSKFELQPVLQSVAVNAARLCRADGAAIFRLESGVYRFVAGYSLNPAELEIERLTPIPPGPGTVVGRAAMTRICDATFGNIYRWDSEALHLVATRNTPPEFADARSRLTLRPGSTSLIGRMLATKAVVHIADVAATQAYEQRVPETVAAVEVGGVRTILVRIPSMQAAA
jgi:hypothetical protein